MTNQEQKELRSYCSFLMKEYGFAFSTNDPVIPALYIIHKEMQLNNENNKAIASQVEKASSKVNPKVFHFNSPGEAWKFQLGFALNWITISLPPLFVVWIVGWYWSIKEDIEQARLLIHASDNISVLTKRVKKHQDGYYFIDFTSASKDSAQHFTEFQKLNAKTIRVYVGRVSK